MHKVGKKRWIVALVLGLCCLLQMGMIYQLSSEDNTESNVRSAQISEQVKYQIQKLDAGTGIGEKIKAFIIKYSPYGPDWNLNVRKMAHFTIYFVLSSFIYILLLFLNKKQHICFLGAVGICFLFACTDELHQLFSGRGAAIKDVVLDTSGACSAAIIISIISVIYTKCWNKRHCIPHK